MRTLLLVSLSATALIACEPAIAPPAENAHSPIIESTEMETETARLTAWFDKKYVESLEFSPLNKTMLGIRDASYGEIDDMSLAAEDAVREWRRKSVDEMKASFVYEKLTDDAKLSWDLWVDELARADAAAEFPFQPYIFEQMNGPQGFFPQFLIQFHTVESEAEMLAYISRIKGLSRALNQLMDRTEEAATHGVRAPKFAMEGVVDQVGKVLVGAPFDDSDAPSGLLADAQGKIRSLEEAGTISNERAVALNSEAEAAYATDFLAALSRVRDWHLAQIPELGEPVGASALPDGAAYYQQRLNTSTTTTLTADEIHDIGLSEVARLRTEMVALKDSVGFDGSLNAFFEFVRTDSQFFFPNTDEGRQGYIDGATAYINFIKSKLPDYFGILPKADLEVKRVEAFREQDGAAQHYFPGTTDGSRPGIYYAHLSDMTAMPKNQMEVIAYHEGLPGHHMQISIAQELTGIPKFRTQIFHNAYAEGWALYSEYLAREMGAYQDPYSEFGRLSSEIWRGIRLVVDTGLHAKGWTEEEAVAYFLDNSPEPEESIRSEVRRYIVWPGQATSYKIGMLKILEVRQKAMNELGDDFNIKTFHDVVLGGGSVPMDLLEQRIDQWIAIEKAKG